MTNRGFGLSSVNPFEIEPPSEDAQHQLILGAPSRSRTWEKMSVIKHGYAAYEASPEKFPSGYITDIQDDIIRIHFGRITDDEELIEILVGVQSTDLGRLLDQPAVELVEDGEE